ncbi:MarR family winged helix-turn-helix transcriptional regulator [Subtercola endophyticus]|uniref:MarR family winged helix-turn-helix transcriptional regulator n=1 Tax=Subtercola endophyticus TaxID=2895559 RepID=UPI001E64E97C|nr:MarR family transcriptional regulator [Subtercola endophyticus]UFS58457.1 MarR family transcriptional regulator [Subtercola endophyticus]
MAELTPGSFELTRQIARLAGMLEGVLQPQLANAGLTRAEYDILGTLKATAPDYRLRPTDLSRRAILTSGGTSNAIRRLEERALISRAKDSEDARSSWIQLTPEGRTLIDSTLAAVSRGASTLFHPAAHLLPQSNQALADVIAALAQ